MTFGELAFGEITFNESSGHRFSIPSTIIVAPIIHQLHAQKLEQN